MILEKIKAYLPTIIIALVASVGALVFYAPMFAFQEGFQIFMWDMDFFVDNFSHPGGFSEYLSFYIVQFFMYNAYLAIIFALFFAAMHLLTKALIERAGEVQLSDSLACICPIFMMLALTEYHLLFAAEVSVLLALLVAFGVSFAKNGKWLMSLSLIGVIVTYWLCGGIATVVYICAVSGVVFNRLGRQQFCVSVVGGALLLALTFLITKNILMADTVNNYFYGIDYNRQPDNPLKCWQFGCVVSALVFVFSPIVAKMLNIKKLSLVRIIIFAVPLIVLVAYASNNYHRQMISFYKYDQLSRLHRWDKIVTMSEKNPPITKLSYCYLNLALNEMGLLTGRMFNFDQQGPEGLMSSDINDQIKALVNSEIYFRLGLMNIAERYSIDCVESNQVHYKSARQYKRLAEIAIIENNKPLATRYLNKLTKTTFYSSWAEYALDYINGKGVEPMKDWQIEPLRFPHKMFFGESKPTALLVRLYDNNPNSQKVYNYMCAYLMLEKNYKGLVTFLNQYPSDFPLGTHVQEAFLMFLYNKMQGNYKSGFKGDEKLVQRFDSFISNMNLGNANTDQFRANFSGTFWYYCAKN